MQSTTRCTLCNKPALPGSETCESHPEAMGTAETLMPNTGAQAKLYSPNGTGQNPRLTAGNYMPALSPSGEQEIFGSGAVLGEYIIEKKIGEGGMGEVWSARQPTINKRVAVKLLNIHIKDDATQLARFKREALVVNQVKHRHLVDIFSFGELPDKRPYFVMEFLEGETLTSFLKKRGTLTFQHIDILFGQLCRALQAAHDQGIVHRDLKPDNIFMLAGDDEIFAKVLDFGIAKLDDGEGLTKTGTRFGTPTYMSPEQCRESKNVDHRSDIYALGIILYEMLCGKTPFYQKGDPVVRVMIRHQSETAKPPSTVVPQRNIPRGLDALIVKVLAKEEANRPQSCAEFYAELKKVLPKKEDGTLEDLPPLPKSATVVAPKSSNNNGQAKLISAIVVGAALLGVTAAALLAKSKKAETKKPAAVATPLVITPSSVPTPTSVAVATPEPDSIPVPPVNPPAADTNPKPTKPKAGTKNSPKNTTPKVETPAVVTPKTENPPGDSGLKNNTDSTLKPKFKTQ